MYLTLEVVSPQAASMGAERRRLVGPNGLTIGRVPGNDWVIMDPYVSRHHARISFENGGFVVEGLGSNPIAIGRSDNTIQANQPRRLNNGDRLFIDQYEIIVTVQQGEIPGAVAASQPTPAEDDPFSLLEPSSSANAPGTTDPAGVIPERWEDTAGSPAFAETITLDPLAALGAPSGAAAPEVAPVNWQQASPLHDHLTLPPVAAPPVRPSVPAPGGIPDNWDRTGLTHIEASPGPVVEPAKQAPPVPPRRPDPPPRRAAPPPPARPRRPDPPPRHAAPPPPASPPPESVKRTTAQTVITPTHQSWSEPSGNAPAPAPRGAAPAASLELVELLRGAGLSDREMSPEMLQELGKALRIVVQGLMEVLQARTEIKSQFRLPLTRVKAVENNPLKLSPNVESALHMLFVQRNPGYLGTAAAFEDAFADIRAHQLAMLAGVRAAFDSMLNSFAPSELEGRFERTIKHGGLLGGLSGKMKYWDLYAEHFDELRGDPEDTFRRLFGEVFAEAYEQQLERLRAVARYSGHSGR